MLIIYNSLQLLIIITFFPLLLIYVALKTKYRHQVPKRLGAGLRKKLLTVDPHKKVIWIHALSVGEVTSALSLVTKIRQENKNITIIFSASTSSGLKLAEELFSKSCDMVIPFPLDFYPVAAYFIDLVKPDLFILVETDFWPNFLNILQRKTIPAVLVNGRISDKSFQKYSRYTFFFSPMFQSFKLLCVQNDSDRDKFITLGTPAEKILKLGNLKYESTPPENSKSVAKILTPCSEVLFVAGSTHPGEERIILESIRDLPDRHPIKIIIAPRDINRSGELEQLASEFGLTTQLHTAHNPISADMYIIDTIGDLAGFYMYADICFVGGSLVDEGGHNPLEPANFAKPVLFGPFMTDFTDITKNLIDSGGAHIIKDAKQLTDEIYKLITSSDYRMQMGSAAQKCCNKMHGSLDKHMEIIRNLI